jgi:hypothetical protein
VATRWRYEVERHDSFPIIQQLLKQNQQLTGAPEEIRTPDPPDVVWRCGNLVVNRSGSLS